MAVSGAAASADMGAATIKPLTPTLALLNIRLAYWLPQPQMGGTKRLLELVGELLLPS
jgi:hypothetical protein